MKKYKAGIVGCGRIGSEFDDDPKRKTVSTHAGAYTAVSQTDLVAAADLDREKLDKCGEKWGIGSLYEDYEEMLKEEDLDILSICTWNSLHSEIARKAVEHDVKAIFCEKPIADRLDAADKMIEACKEKDVILMIDHQRRFDEFHQNVKKFIDEGGPGEIQQTSFYYTRGIANTGSHVFDLLRFFFGDADWIYGTYSENQSYNPEDPNIDGIIKFENGVFCALQACSSEKFLIFEMDIIGSKGRMMITHSGFDLDFYEVRESELFSGHRELFRSESPIDKDTPREFMIRGVQHLVECLEEDKEPISSGVDGRKSLELICAFHESAKAGGKQIHLPLKSSDVRIKSR